MTDIKRIVMKLKGAKDGLITNKKQKPYEKYTVILLRLFELYIRNTELNIKKVYGREKSGIQNQKP